MSKISHVAFAILLIFLAYGCQDKTVIGVIGELEKYQSQEQIEKQNKEIGIQFFNALDENDFDGMKNLITESFTIHVPGLPEPVGFDFLQEAVETHYASFPDWIHVIEDVIADGDKIAIRLSQNGIHKAEFEGIPATGIKTTMQAMHIARIEKGKISEWWVLDDYFNLIYKLIR